MKNKIRVLLIDSDVNQMSSIEKYFSSNSVIKVVKLYSDGVDAFNYINSNYNEFDLVIMDLLLPNKDGLSIIKSIRNIDNSKRIIVTTGYSTLSMIKKTSVYNIDYFMLKPFDIKDLENHIFEVNTQDDIFVNRDKELQSNISNLLHSLGVPSHIKGYQYIREGIGLIMSKPSMLGAITKEMYPQIAVKFNTTSSRVERAIRHAIEISWTRGDYDLMEEVFGHSVDYDRAKPTNSEFIATIADKLRLESK